MPNLTPDPAAGSSLTTSNTSTTNNPPSPNDTSAFGDAASANSSVDSNATASSESLKIPLKVNRRPDDFVQNNPLDAYINVTYHVNLAMVSNDAVKKLQQADVQSAEISSSDYIIFCSTGDADTDKSTNSGDRDYYNIKSFSFVSTLGHLPQNPVVSAIWDGKMKILEPYGFSLREDLEQMAVALKYPNEVSPLNFVFRLEVSFSGWNPKTGEWVPKISIPVHTSKSIPSIIYYLVITTCEARVTAVGTEYDLSFQTFAHLTTRAESIILHKDTMETGGTGSGNSTANAQSTVGMQFRTFLKSLANALHRQVLVDTQQHVDITYEFVGLKTLFDATFISDVSKDVATGVTFNPETGAYVVSGKSVDLYTVISQTLDSLKLVRDLRLREDDPNFTSYNTEWNIRTNIKETQSPDSKINNYKKWTFQYIIEPVLTFRCRTTEVPQRNPQAEYANQTARAQAMADLGMIVRKYDYIFTNNNSEIIDFQFRFKMFYYVPYPYSGSEITTRGHGAHTMNNTAVPDLQKLRNSSGTQDASEFTKPDFMFTVKNPADLDTILGAHVPPASSANTRNYRNVFGGFNRGPNMPQTQGSATAANQLQQKNSIARDQYLRYDMLDAQMTVRFDPVWLMNPYMSGKDFTPEVTTDQQEDGVFCYAHVDRVVLIRAYRPNQKSFMNPDVSTFTARTGPILGGFYQVLTVVNKFEGGRMTQDLNMIKYDHLNYFVDTVFNTTGQPNSTLTSDPKATAALG